MKVYVAGKFENYIDVQLVQQMAVTAGHKITYDWTPIAVQVANGSKDGKDLALLEQCGNNDAWGVKMCHTFIALAHPKLYGTIVELGMALALHKDIWLVGDWEDRVEQCPFFHIPHINYSYFTSLYQVREALQKMAPEGVTKV